MATNPTVGARTALTVTGLSTLAAATYVASIAYNCDTNKPIDVVIEVAAGTTNATSGNAQLVVFIQESLDGTNFRSGPTSGTTTTDEAMLRLCGVIPLPNAGTKSGLMTFSVFNALGFVPKQFKVVLKNDMGVALTTGTVYTSEITIP